LAILRCNPPIHGWDDRYAPPCLAYWLRWWLTNFLLELDLKCDSLDYCLLSSWHCRHHVQPKALIFSFILTLKIQAKRQEQCLILSFPTFIQQCKGICPNQWLL
jgi:hypothetical protein